MGGETLGAWVLVVWIRTLGAQALVEGWFVRAGEG